MSESNNARPSLVTIAQAATALSVHPQTIRDWLGNGAPHLRVGRVVRIDLDRLLAWASTKNEGKGETTMNNMNESIDTQPSKYTPAINEAANVEEPSDAMSLPNAPKGLSSGLFSATWGDAPNCNLAWAAAVLAAYAEHGELVDGSPVESFQHLVQLLLREKDSGVVSSASVFKQVPALKALCIDAMTRASTDETLDAGERHYCQQIAETFGG